MKKYTLNTDKKEAFNKTDIPSDAVINKYKSFNNLRTSYEDVTKPPTLPLYKNKKLFLFLILIAVVAWVIAETANDEDAEKEETKIEITE